MPPVPTSNNGTMFYNQNECKSFNISLSSTLVALANFPCSEVTIVNRTGQDVFINDNNNSSIANSFLIADKESFTFRGITNSNTVSAKTTVGTGTLYYRTAYFSSLPQR